jgi:NitT/TauT family transport system substrate-binding protein
LYNVIKIAYGAPTHISALPVRYGVARGIFAQAGLDLSVRTIFGGPELALALDRGALWIGEIGSPPGITAIAHGAGLRIVASAEKRPALMYLGLHQSIEAWSELRGERIGVLTTGSCGYWFLREILTRNGLDPDRDVEIVQLGKRYPDVLQLIEDRIIEGALLVEPFLSTCVLNGTVRNWGCVAALDYIPPLQWSVQVARTAMIEEQPDTVRRTVDAVAGATRAAYGDVADYAAFLSNYLKLPLAVAEHAVERERKLVALDGELDLTGLTNAIELQVTLGGIPAGIKLDDVIDRRFARGAAAANSS